MSGGRATLSVKTTNPGDISAIHPDGYALIDCFSIECKSYKDLGIKNLIYGRKAALPGFWAQAKRDADRKLPLLIAKQNFFQPLLCMNTDGKKLLLDNCGTDTGNVSCLLRATFQPFDMHVVFFDQFIKNVPPSILKRLPQTV